MTTLAETTLTSAPDLSGKLIAFTRTLTPGERLAFGAVMRAAREALGEDVIGFDIGVGGDMGIDSIPWHEIIPQVIEPLWPVPPRDRPEPALA